MQKQTFQEWRKEQNHLSDLLKRNPALKEWLEDKYDVIDWLDEKIETKDLNDLEINGKITKVTLRRIRFIQKKAFIGFIGKYLELRQNNFRGAYNSNLLRDDLLSDRITKTERILKKIKEENHSIYLDAFDYYSNGSNNITPQQVKVFLPNIIDVDWGSWVEQSLYLDFKKEYNTPIAYIIEANFLKWLYWFKEQQSLDKTEPLINLENYSPNLPNSIKGRTPKLAGKTSINQAISYIWQGPLEGIDLLYSLLIQGGFMPDTTEMNNFKALFTGKPLKQIKHLEWLQKKNLLAYLIDQLYDNSMFPDDTNYWSIAEACFTDTKNLKQLKSNYLDNKQGKPKGFSQIDFILKTIEQFTNPLPVNY